MDSTKKFPDAVYVDGKVAVRFNQPIPKYVQVGNKAYVFEVRHNVSLMFVNEDEVQPLLDFLGGCCGKRQHVISLVPPAVYSHWLDGQGGR